MKKIIVISWFLMLLLGWIGLFGEENSPTAGRTLHLSILVLLLWLFYRLEVRKADSI